MRRATLDEGGIDLEVGIAQAREVFGGSGRRLFHQGDAVACQDILVAGREALVGAALAPGADDQLVGRRRLDELRRQPEGPDRQQQRGQRDKDHVAPGKQLEFLRHVHLSGSCGEHQHWPTGA
jgi:hypothetical protein